MALIFRPSGSLFILIISQIRTALPSKRCTLNRVSRYEYLGHISNEDHSDNDVVRERRLLSVRAMRANMLAHRFPPRSVNYNINYILTKFLVNCIFRAYCQSSNTGTLWIHQRATCFLALTAPVASLWMLALIILRNEHQWYPKDDSGKNELVCLLQVRQVTRLLDFNLLLLILLFLLI